MAYTFLPPRQQFFPSGPPYLAGLRGLGDWASDNAAYQAYLADLAKWTSEKAAYDAALVAWQQSVAAIDKQYALDLNNYKLSKVLYDKRFGAFQAKYAAIAAQRIELKKTNTALSIERTKNFGITLPQSYFDNGACITSRLQAGYAANCQTVKGLGLLRGLGSSDPDCAMARLPICNYPDLPTFTLAAPKMPAAPVYPAKPTLRAAPTPVSNPGTPPVTVTTPTVPTSSGGGGGSGPSSSSTPIVTQAEEPKQAGMLMNGLILVAVLGGSYLVYRTLKKPKAQAA